MSHFPMLSLAASVPRYRLRLAMVFLIALAGTVDGQTVHQTGRGDSGTAASVKATGSASTAQPAVCPKCGRVHGTSTRLTTATTTPSVATAASRVSTGAQNVLAILNRQRSRQGLRSLRYDASLQAVAERRARQMASMGLKSHPPGSFAPGRYEGVGWSSSFSPNGVHACYTSNPNMRVAGAAMVRGRDGMYFAVVYR